MQNLIYYLGLSALLTHEMDAVMRAEWRLLFVLRTLSDAAAHPVFVALHLPLIFVLLWLSHAPNRRLRLRFRQAVAGFLVVHAVLHWWLSDRSGYAFEGGLSNLYIYLAAVLGAVYLALSVRVDRTGET